MSTDRTQEQISEEWAAASDGREVSSYLWEEVINTRRARDEAREDRDSAEATIARLQAEIAHLSRERDDAADRMTSALARMDGAEATIARLQDDVVELTQAGDLHRKEGDEARAHLCELLPLAQPWSSSARARITAAREYLAALDLVEHPSHPDTVLDEVRVERVRQDTKWGEQNHADTVHTTRISHGIAASDVYRRCIQARPSWALILLEEVSEAVEAIGDVTALRAELVQVAAVATAWVEAIDRRQGGAA